MNRNIKNSISILLTSICLLLFCTGCSLSGAQSTMPYSSSEYESNGWTAEELVKHFEELGFDDIDISESESRYAKEEFIEVRVEDADSDSLFTEYTEFEKGEPLRTWRKIKINVTYPIPVLTIENCPELVNVLPTRYSTEDSETWNTFMQEHVTEYIEFDGIITDWYDELWYAGGISFTVCFEDYEDITFSWHGISTSDFGYKNDYYTGCIEEGIPAHIVARIFRSDEGYYFELESIELMNN